VQAQNEMKPRTAVGRRVRDFVCGMEVDSARTGWRHVHQGETYYFCHPRCLSKFRSIPRLYLRAAFARRAERPTVFVEAKTWHSAQIPSGTKH